MKNIFKKLFHIHKWKMIPDGVSQPNDEPNNQSCDCGITRHRVWIGAVFGYWSPWKYRKVGDPRPTFNDKWDATRALSIRNLFKK
jgi:hypothetical protein